MNRVNIFLVIIELLELCGGRTRPKVFYTGTTQDPNFHRNEGQRKDNTSPSYLEHNVFLFKQEYLFSPFLKKMWIIVSSPCPESHGYGFDNGRHCCRSGRKVDNTTMHPECDGELISFETNILCCQNEDFVTCTPGRVCSDRHRGNLV